MTAMYSDDDGPAGCVNCVHFTESGRKLISGSDDQHICIGDWFIRVSQICNLFPGLKIFFHRDARISQHICRTMAAEANAVPR